MKTKILEDESDEDFGSTGDGREDPVETEDVELDPDEIDSGTNS